MTNQAPTQTPGKAIVEALFKGIPTADDFLKSGINHMRERANTYDSPEGERSMAKTVAMFNEFAGTAITEEQGWRFMEILKMVRSSQGDFKADNYEDGAAYCALAGEAAAVADAKKTKKPKFD